MARKIGHVIDIAYDPKVSQKETFIRAHVRLDIANPATARRMLNIPSGGQVMIEFEYEKLRKGCFHCLRLTHERPDCPLLRSKVQRSSNSTSNTAPPASKMAVAVKQAPVLQFSVPSGFEPLFPELSPEDRVMTLQYIAHSDPTERQARILRVKQSVRGVDATQRSQIPSSSLFHSLPPEERDMAMQYVNHSDPTERQARILRFSNPQVVRMD